MTTVKWHEGDVVRKLRATFGWKLKHLAAKSGVNLQTIHRLESGITKESKRETLTKLAAAFGLTPRHLFDTIPASVDLPIQLQHRPVVKLRREVRTTRRTPAAR